MRFLAYDMGRCKAGFLGWFVLSCGRLARLRLFGEFLLLLGEAEGVGDMTAVINQDASPNLIDRIVQSRLSAWVRKYCDLGKRIRGKILPAESIS